MSSSHATDAAEASCSKSGDVTKAPCEVRTLRRHDDVVFIDDDSAGQTILTQVLTHERFPLPRGDEWQLVFDEAGYGAVVCDSEDPPKLLEDLLKLQLYVCSDGTWVVDDMSKPDRQTWSLTDHMRKYKSGQVSWRYQLSHDMKMLFCALFVPRGGCRFFFQAATLYKVLGMVSYKGNSSKWVYESAPAWRKHLEPMGFKDFLLHSPAGEAVDVALNSVTHFLPWIGVSSVALVALLVRMCHPVTQKGGLVSEVARKLCESQLEGLLKGLAPSSGEQPWRIPVRWLYTWTSKWPRPEAHDVDVHLEVSLDGQVDFEPWIALAQQCSAKNNRPRARWLRDLEFLGQRCSLVRLLLVCGHADNSARMSPLYAQLLRAVASRLEAVLQERVREKPSSTPRLLQAFFHNPEDGLQTPRDVDVLILRHVGASKQTLERRHLHMTLASDASSVKGLKLTNTALALPSNVACCCPPQVAMCTSVILCVEVRNCAHLGV